MSHKPTAEQQSIIDALNNHDMLKVEACAGSGKTSTLVMTAQAHAAKSLYLAFNKVTANEAAQKFPKHVECRTTHSMAYAAFGAKMAHKLSRPRGAYVNVAGTGSEIARYYKISPIQFSADVVVGEAFIGILAKQTVARYEQSADESLKIAHVPAADLHLKLDGNKSNVESARNIVLKVAKKLWKDRIDLKSPVLATHDTYLKLFQLSKPVFKGVEILYVDEFQDTTPCVLDIVMNQRKHMKVVMVGDARQAIYGWRGAINAMQQVSAEVRYLTKSFRYGQAVADIATTVLEGAMRITGNESIVSIACGRDNTVIDLSKPHTRLFRTNTALLSAAVEEIAKGTPVSIEVDVADLVRVLQSALALFQSDKKGVKHEKIVPYNTWGELLVESKVDPDLGRVAKAVAEGTVHRWVDVLQSFVNAEDPMVTFTTAHKSKGREWSQVIVEDDFRSGYNEDGDWTGLETEEQNLLYVACTRAIHVLQYNSTVEGYLNQEHASNHARVLKKLERELVAEGFAD